MLTAKQVSEMYGVTVSTVHYWARDGAPHTFDKNRLSRNEYRLFDATLLQEWLDEQYAGTKQPKEV